MLRMKMMTLPNGIAINTLWELFPEGDAGTFLFHSEGITIDFYRVGDEYFYEMKEGEKRVAFHKQLIGLSMMAHIDKVFYTFVHGHATDIRRL